MLIASSADGECLSDKIYSNAGSLQLNSLMQNLYELDREKKFLNPAKRLIVIDKTTHAINEAIGIIAEILGFSLGDSEKYRIRTTQYGHHIVAEETTMVGLIPLYGIARAVLARAKCCDSIVEKLAKVHGDGKLTRFGKLNLEDVNGFKIACDSEQDAYSLVKRLQGRFKVLDDEDYMRNPKPSGYKALHTTLADSSGNIFEVQVKSVEQAREDAREHASYAARRLGQNGHGNLDSAHQIVIFDNRALFRGQWHFENDEYRVALVNGNMFADYWLVHEKNSKAPDEIKKLKNTTEFFEKLRE